MSGSSDVWPRHVDRLKPLQLARAATVVPMPRCVSGRRRDCVANAVQSPSARRLCKFPPLRTALPKRRTGWDSKPRDACPPAGFQDRSPGDDAVGAQRAENQAPGVALSSARDQATPRPLCRNETRPALCRNSRNLLLTSHEQDRSCSAGSDAKRRAVQSHRRLTFPGRRKPVNLLNAIRPAIDIHSV